LALEYVALTLIAAEVGMFMGDFVAASPARAMRAAVEEVEMDAMTATSSVTPPVRGPHSFPSQLSTSSFVHRTTQINS